MTMGLFLNAIDLDVLFPARIEATREGRIIRLGASLERLVGAHHLGVDVLDMFVVERPARVKCFADVLAKSAHVVLRARGAPAVRLQGKAHVAGDLVYFLVGHTLDLASASETLLTHEDFSPADGSSEAFLAAAVQAQFATDARRLAHELEHARKAAETANNAKSAFLANVTHELRTPLNAIIGYSELMREDAVEDGRDASDHDHVLTAAKGLLGMINDVLDYTLGDAAARD
jgi:signal transduction histidine kinase